MTRGGAGLVGRTVRRSHDVGEETESGAGAKIRNEMRESGEGGLLEMGSGGYVVGYETYKGTKQVFKKKRKKKRDQTCACDIKLINVHHTMCFFFQTWHTCMQF